MVIVERVITVIMEFMVTMFRAIIKMGLEVTETKMFMQVTTIIAMMETVIIMEREVEVQIILVTELEVVEKVQVFIHLLVRNMKLQ